MSVNVEKTTKDKRKFTFDFSELFDSLKYALYITTHPADGYWTLKVQNKFQSRSAVVVLYALLFISALVKRQLTSFDFSNSYALRLNVFIELFATLAPYFLWCVALWCVSSLMEGESTMWQIVKYTAFALMPIIITNFLSTGLSWVLVGREYMIFSLIMQIGTLWSLGLIFMSVVICNQYSVLKTVGVVLLSLLGMIIIACLALLFFYLLQQLVTFFTDVLREYTFRIAE